MRRFFPAVLPVFGPFGDRVRPTPKGLADFAAVVDLGDGVRGLIEGFRRIDPVSRTPALSRRDYEGTDFTVVSERKSPRPGADALELTIVRTDGGIWSAMRHVALRRGEGVVVVRAVATSSDSKEAALATLEAHRGEVDAFLAAVTLPSGPGKPPR